MKSARTTDKALPSRVWSMKQDCGMRVVDQRVVSFKSN